MAGMEEVVTKQLEAVAHMVEEQVDAELNRLDNLDEDGLESIRQKRLVAMKKQQAKKQEWLQLGHGQYEEIPEEKEFFEVTRKSERCVVHFYRSSTERCKIFDKHLRILADKHVETKFAKIDAEKCPFLTDRLKVRVIPTLVLVKDGKTKGFIVGFTDLGNKDDFSTDMLEWRLGCLDMINYSGDLMTPPDQKGSSSSKVHKIAKKTVRGKSSADSSDEDDW